MAWGSFAWDLARNLSVKCCLFCTKFILKHLYLAKNSLYKNPLFLRKPARGPEHSFVEIEREIFSMVILSLPLIQEVQLSVSGGRMCTILVNYLEDCKRVIR